VLQVLHNPRYAGAFFFGRTRTRMGLEGMSCTQLLPREDWLVLIPQAHVGYITWEEYEDNQRRLHASAQAQGAERRKSPPREGPALLQGLVICGVCGRRMTVRYHERHGQLYPEYICQDEKVHQVGPLCQCLPGQTIDAAVTQLLLETMTPVSLEGALAVQQEIDARQVEADALRAKQVARAQYEADLAGQRYRRVDPNNRLVADALEAEWNTALRGLQETQREYERLRQQESRRIDEHMRAQVLALSTDFPRVWHDPQATDHDRKRLIRLLLEDVTLIKTPGISVRVRFRGGATRTLTLPPVCRVWQTWETPPEVLQTIDTLLNEHTDQQIAALLNERGLHPGKGGTFTGNIVTKVRRAYGLKSRYERLREAGKLTDAEMAQTLAIHVHTVKKWHQAGLLRGYAYNDKNSCLYDPPGPDAPVKGQGRKLSRRRQLIESQIVSKETKEVQCEA